MFKYARIMSKLLIVLHDKASVSYHPWQSQWTLKIKAYGMEYEINYI